VVSAFFFVTEGLESSIRATAGAEARQGRRAPVCEAPGGRKQDGSDRKASPAPASKNLYYKGFGNLPPDNRRKRYFQL